MFRALRATRVICASLFAAGALGAGLPAAALADEGDGTCDVPTAHHPTIQSAVNDPACERIRVAPGVYNEDVSVGRSLILRGPNWDHPGAGHRNSEASVKSMHVTASDVVIRGFSFYGTTGSQMNVSSTSSSTALSDDVVGDSIFSGYGSVGFTTFNAGDVSILANLFKNPQPNSEAIQIRAPMGSHGCTGTRVVEDTFTAASNNGGADVNLSCTGSDSRDVLVRRNRSTGLSGGTSFASFSGVTDAISVLTNDVMATSDSGSLVFFFGDVSGSAHIAGNRLTGGGSSAVSIHGGDLIVQDGPNTGSFLIQQNDLSENHRSVRVAPGAMGAGGEVRANRNDVSDDSVAGMENANGTSFTIDGVCNWWGSATGPWAPTNPSGTGDKALGPIRFKPWLTSPHLDGDCD